MLSDTKSKKNAYDVYLWVGYALIVLLVGGFALWSFFAPIQGAVIAPGTVVVEGKPRTLQHLDGGIVGEILVRDGDKVNAGDVVMRLDPTSLNASRDLVQKRLNEALAMRARLIAERDAAKTIPWENVFPVSSRDQSLTLIIEDHDQLFETRKNVVKGELGQLRKRLEQTGEQISGFKSQLSASQSQLELIEKELQGLEVLFKEGFVSQTRILALEREKAGLTGQIATLEAEIERAKTVLEETNIEILQVTRSKKEAVLTELRQKESEISDLQEQLISANDQADRVDILAPVSGWVHNMTITTVGGVVTSANPIMDIIPDTDRLIIEAQLEPMYIDQLYLGQPTTVRLSAFNQRTTPELNGAVKSVSANSTVDKLTGIPFYTVVIEVPEDEIARLNGLVLVPGMPAEAFMQTDKRTIVNYLLKPATDQLNRAFREE
jgi:HlyD family secretion protein